MNTYLLLLCALTATAYAGSKGYGNGNGNGNGEPVPGENGVPTGTAAPDGDCADTDDLCLFWAWLGECEDNSVWMEPNCCASCGHAEAGKGKDYREMLKKQMEEAPAEEEEPAEEEPAEEEPAEEEEPAPDATEAPEGYGDAETEAPAEEEPEEEEPVEEEEPEEEVLEESEPVDCADEHDDCCAWANMEECDKNPFWMRVHCPESCGTCGCTVDTALDCEVSVTCEAEVPEPGPDATDAPDAPDAPDATDAPAGEYRRRRF